VTWLDVAWFVPLMLAIAVVVGATGRNEAGEIRAAVRRRFLEFTVMVLAVGVVIRLVVIYLV
jgi:uncharacterized protein HemY